MERQGKCESTEKIPAFFPTSPSICNPPRFPRQRSGLLGERDGDGERVWWRKKHKKLGRRRKENISASAGEKPESERVVKEVKWPFLFILHASLSWCSPHLLPLTSYYTHTHTRAHKASSFCLHKTAQQVRVSRS